MEGESLDVFCETVPSECDGIESEDVVNSSPLTKLEYAQGEDCDMEPIEGVYDEGHNEEQEISFEAELNADDIEISQNDEEDHEPLEDYKGDEDDNVDADPTETLQKVLMEQELALQQLIPVKQEPLLDGEDDDEVDKAMNVEFEPTIPRPSDPTIPGSALDKVSTTTRSGRKSTIIKFQRRKRGPNKNVIQELPSPKPFRRRKGKRMSSTKQQRRNELQEKKARKGPTNVQQTKEPSLSPPPTEDAYAECLVCNSPSVAIQKNKKPSRYHPFCTKCKKAYFYQQSQAKRHSSPRSCRKKGNCKIDYRCQQNWCSHCHFEKFNSILSSLYNDSNDQYEENADDIYSTKRLRRGGKQNLSSNELIMSSPSVLMEKMTAEQLAEYGIVTEHAVKQEPVDYEQHRPLSHSTNDLKKRPPAKLGPWRGRKRKVLMTTIPSSSETESENETKTNSTSTRSLNHLSDGASTSIDKDYTLPGVSIGHETVFNRSCGPPINIPTSGVNTQKQNNFTEVLDSLKVYVFTCGHACGLCNSLHSKKWLEDSGFFTSKPVLSSTFPTPGLSQAAMNSKQTTKSTDKKIMSSNRPNLHTQNVISKSAATGNTNSRNSSSQVLQSLLKTSSIIQIPTGAQKQQQSWITLPLSKSNSCLPINQQLVTSPTANPSQNVNVQSVNVNTAHSTTIPINNKQQTMTKTIVYENPKNSSLLPLFLDTAVHAQSTTKPVQPSGKELSVKEILQTMNLIPAELQTSHPIKPLPAQAVTKSSVPSVSTLPLQPITYQHLIDLQKKGLKLTTIVPQSPQAASTTISTDAGSVTTSVVTTTANKIPLANDTVVIDIDNEKPTPSESTSKDSSHSAN